MIESLKNRSENMHETGNERAKKNAEDKDWLGEDVPQFHGEVLSSEMHKSAEPEAEQFAESETKHQTAEPEAAQWADESGAEQRAAEAEAAQRADTVVEQQKPIGEMNRQELATEYLDLLKGFGDNFTTTDETVKKYREQHAHGVFAYGKLRTIQQLAQGIEAETDPDRVEAATEDAGNSATEEMRVADAMVARLLFIRKAEAEQEQNEQMMKQLSAEAFEMSKGLSRFLKRSEIQGKRAECDQLVNQNRRAEKIVDRCTTGIEDEINWFYGQDGPETAWPRPESDRDKRVQAFMHDHGEALERAVDLREKMDIPQQYDLARRMC